MTDQTERFERDDAHRVHPAFRDRLERELMAAYRRDAVALAGSRWHRLRWLRTAAAIALGATLASGADFAIAQVRDARQRSELSDAIASRVPLAELRLAMVRSRVEQARAQSALGAISRLELSAAEAELVSMQAVVARLRVELAETQATAAAPRDELWAPRVGQQDFVSQRLALDLREAEQLLALHRDRVAIIEQQVRVGAQSSSALADAKLQLTTAAGVVDDISMRLTLRRAFLEERLAPEVIQHRLERFRARAMLLQSLEGLRVAKERLETARQQAAKGATAALEVLRAELQVQELQVSIIALERQLGRLEASARR